MKALNSKDKHSSSANASMNLDKTTSGGLLLLSTKKSVMDRKLSNNISGTGNNNHGKGNASSSDKKNKGISTHDALMNALNGDCGNTTKEKVPLAWGLKDPTTVDVTAAITVDAAIASSYTVRSQDASNNIDADADAGDGGMSQSQTNHCKIDNCDVTIEKVKPTIAPFSNDVIHANQVESKQQDPLVHVPAPAPAPAEDQVEFMKKLAKERAEKRRQEEEERDFMQKQKASQRLLELELKLGKHSHGNSHAHAHVATVSAPVSAPVPVPTAAITTGGRQAEVVVNEQSHHLQHGEAMQKEANARFSDPSRTYSSLLRGGESPAISNPHSHPPSGDMNHGTAPMPTSSMIQLNSYDDRDRGGRSSGSGPRMLFDPKSGSMVAVSSNSTKDKKSKIKLHRNNNTTMALKSKSITNDNNVDDDDDDDEDFEGASGSSRRKSARVRQRVAKRSAKREEITTVAKPKKGSTLASDGHSSSKTGRVLPRTCGVLYKRDDAKGQFVSSDGCEGDQGYGAHSVPGGRIRNAKVYSALKQKAKASGKQGKNSSTATFNADSSTDTLDVPAYHDRHAHAPSGVSSSSGDYEYNRGLNRSHFMRKSQHQPMTKIIADDAVEFSSSVLDVVTGDEKMDLFSGLDTSPKLQATAAAWAPSEAVLALAAANLYPVKDIDSESHDDISESGVHAMNAMALIDNESTHDDDVDDVEASPSIGLGLGFDPSENMDSLMMSPAMEDETPRNIPGFSTFNLKESTALPKPSSNPFRNSTSMLGSSPWGISAGNTNTMGSLSNWDLLGSGNKGVEEDIQKNQSPSAFLSLGVGGGQHTWGGNGTSSKFSGFSGIDSPSSMGSSDSQNQASS